METIEATVFVEPFPHIIIDNFYNEDELQLIWEELKFFTKPFDSIPSNTSQTSGVKSSYPLL